MPALVRLAAYLLSGAALWGVLGTQNLLPHPVNAGHLALDQAHAMILGVCAGLSRYTGIDVSLIRFAWVLASFYRGIGIALYLLAFLILPVS